MDERMNKKLITILGLLVISKVCLAGALDTLIGNSYKLDKEATQLYLKENKVLSEELIPKMDKFMNHLVVTWERESIHVEAWSGAGTSEYKLVAETPKKIILKVKNELGEWNETRIILTEDGYWQETDVFAGYREKFTQCTPQPKESIQPERDNG